MVKTPEVVILLGSRVLPLSKPVGFGVILYVPPVGNPGKVNGASLEQKLVVLRFNSAVGKTTRVS